MPTNGMTIDGLNTVSALTAQDKVPVWDNESSGEPTRKITAQNMANSVKTLGNLVNTTEMNAAIAQSTAIKTVTQTINATGAWLTTWAPSVIGDVSRIIHINMNDRWIIWRYVSEGRVTMLRLNTAGTDIVVDDTTGNVDVTYYYI
jgi:hypothetical protein